MKAVTGEEMKEIDRRAIEEFGIPGAVLMENAGRGAAEVIEEFLYESGIEKVLIIAGKGNNGGDGFVAARHLANRDAACEVCLIGKKTDVKGDAKTNLDIADKMGIEIREVTDERKILAEAINRAGLIVDALFGTGLSKEVGGFYREVIEAINGSGLPVISLDIPSGLDSSAGRPLGIAVEADMTVTFCLPKVGSLVYPGADYAGELVLADIGAPYPLLENNEIMTSLIRREDVEGILTPRKADSHKGVYGHLLVVAGSRGKTGAAVMTAQGAMRSGAGLATVAAPSGINDILENNLIEVMTEPVISGIGDFLDKTSLTQLLELVKNKDVVVLGPGLSREPETGELLRELIPALSIPVVLDADALWHLANFKETLKSTKVPFILTPHPGEMGRLADVRSKDVQSDRIGISRGFAKEYGCYLILKGARTLVATPEGEVFINTTGNPGMATAGTGDVLCGIVGALLCQGYSPLEASVAGIFIHGEAGDRVAAKKGEVGLIATDIIGELPYVFREMLSRS